MHAASVRAQMLLFIVCLAIVPEPPEDFEPAVGQLAIGFVLRAAMGANSLVVTGCPGGAIDRSLGPLLDNLAEFVVAGVAESNDAGLATLLGDRTGARQGLESFGS